MDKIVNLSLARKSVPTLIDVVQGATAPNIVFVLEDYTPPSNARARLYIKKTNAEVYNDCVLSGNQVTYTPTAGSFDEAGQCVAQLQIVQGNTIAVSWRIFVTVEPNLIEGSAAPASTEYGALESLIINAQQYDTIIGANNLTGANNRQGWTALTSGQDLNTVLGVGMYFTHSNAAASSLAHTPFDKAFVMKVGQVYSSSFITQEATTMGTSVVKEETKRRYTYNGGSTWSEWELQPTRSEVNAIANQGAKNLLSVTGTNQTINGVTFTRNTDGSVTLNGTSTAAVTYILKSDVVERGNYILSTVETGESDVAGGGLYAKTTGGTGTTGGTRLASALRNASATFTNQVGTVWLYYGAGVTFTNYTVYPMMRFASVQDDTYVPYGMSNAELTGRLPQTIAVGSNASVSVPLDSTKYGLFAWTVGNTFGGANLLYFASNNLNAPLIAERGTGTAPTLTYADGMLTIKNNTTTTIRAVLIQ